MANPEHVKTTPLAHPQWSDALQAPTREQMDPRLRTLTAIEHAVTSCAEGLARAFYNFQEVERGSSESDTALRSAIHSLNESLQALKPLQRLTATSPDRMRELFTCTADTANELRILIEKSKEALQNSPDNNRAAKVREMILSCPRISLGLENALVIPLKVTKQEMLGGNDSPQSLTA